MLTHSAYGRARGFTIIELVIAIALVGVMLKLGLPSFTAWISNAKVRTVTDALQNGIRLAQTEALRRNRTVVMSLTNATPAINATPSVNGKFWSLQTVAKLGDTAGEYIQGGALTDVASGVTITGQAAAICFNSNGRLVTLPSSATGVGTACIVDDTKTFYDVNVAGAADRPLRVTVGLAGQVRLCDPNRPARSDTSPDGC